MQHKTQDFFAKPRGAEHSMRASKPTVWHKRRRRLGGQGRPHLCPAVRDALYEWYISMRFSIDWRTYNASCRRLGKYKCMGRFPRSLIKRKLEQLLSDCASDALLSGARMQMFKINSRWFDIWQNEYGLSMKMPTRKYKVPLDVLEERCEIGWLNVFRVRAACEALHGYDMEIENFDQSPYHNNETGSKNVGTLAVAGLEVPLIEGHSDTRERWSGNFTTFSDKARILAGETPYVEAMFKSNADSTAGSGSKRMTIELRMREYIRSRGYGPWLTVATSPKGSYREADVLFFGDALATSERVAALEDHACR